MRMYPFICVFVYLCVKRVSSVYWACIKRVCRACTWLRSSSQFSEIYETRPTRNLHAPSSYKASHINPRCTLVYPIAWNYYFSLLVIHLTTLNIHNTVLRLPVLRGRCKKLFASVSLASSSLRLRESLGTWSSFNFKCLTSSRLRPDSMLFGF